MTTPQLIDSHEASAAMRVDEADTSAHVALALECQARKSSSRISWNTIDELLRVIYLGSELDTGDEFPLSDAIVLHTLALQTASCGATALEVGSWKGRSSIVLGAAMASVGGRLICVDTWQGSEGVAHHSQAVQSESILQRFLANISAVGLTDVVAPHVTSSAAALVGIEDASLDFIFLDGDHRFSAVQADISGFLAKLRPGGLLCGHDCEASFNELPPDLQRQAEEQGESDFIPLERSPFSGIHPGVILALREQLGNDWRRSDPSSVWYYVKPASDDPSDRQASGQSCKALELAVKRSLSEHPLLAMTSPPQLVEAGCEGFNLVRFRNRYLALATSLGIVDLTRTTDTQLDSWIEAGLLKVETNLDSLRQTVRSSIGSEVIRGTYRDHYLVRRGDLVYGLPQGIGSVDLDRPAERNLPQIMTARSQAALCRQLDRGAQTSPTSMSLTKLGIQYLGYELYGFGPLVLAIEAGRAQLGLDQLRSSGHGAFFAAESMPALKRRVEDGLAGRWPRCDGSALVIAADSPDRTREVIERLGPRQVTVWAREANQVAGPMPHILGVTGPSEVKGQLGATGCELVVVPYQPRLGDVPWESLVAPFCRRLLAVFEDGEVRLYENDHFSRILYNMAYLRSMYRQIPSFQGKRVLEVGCSDGLPCDLVAREGPAEVVGVDMLDTVGLLYQNPRCTYRKLDATTLPFEDASFDIVYSIATFEHVHDPLAAFREMKRVLRPGGHGYVQTAPFYYSPFGHHMFGYFDDYPWIHVRLSKTQIIEYARRQGIAARIEADRGGRAEEYIQSMINPAHVNGLLLHEYGVEEFSADPDVEIIGFERSFEGRELLTPEILRECHPVEAEDLVTHGFELVFRRKANRSITVEPSSSRTASTGLPRWSVVTPASSPDLTPEEFARVVGLANGLASIVERQSQRTPRHIQTGVLDRPSESWQMPSGKPVYGTVMPAPGLLQIDYALVNRLRLHCNHFTGYELSNVYQERKSPSWTDALERPGDRTDPSVPDWSIGAFLSLIRDLPRSLVFQPPVKLGESGWRVGDWLINRDILAYQERVVLMHRAGLLERLRALPRLRIIEIGSGYGALAWQLRCLLPRAAYYLCDLPLSLFTSLSYLTLTRPEDPMVLCRESPQEEVPDDFVGCVGLPHHLFSGLDGLQFDLAINTLSFAEMPPSVVEAYASGLARLLHPNGLLFDQNFDNSHFRTAEMSDPAGILARHFRKRTPVGLAARWGPARVWTQPSVRPAGEALTPVLGRH